MATLRERLTPAEQDRFKQLYHQGYFDEITLNRFTQRLGRELRFIDYQTRQLERAGWPHEHLGERPQVPFTNPLTKFQVQQLREKAFDTALQGERGLFDRFFTGERTRQDLQDLDRALGARPDGTLLPKEAGLFASDPADTSIAERAWDRYWQEQGIVGGIAEIAGSSLTAPIRGAGHILSGSLGEHPLEATAAMGSILPIGRAFGRVAGASQRIPASIGRVARSRGLQVPAQGAELADILGAREDVFVEALSEAGLEAVGAGGDVIGDLRSGRMRQILQGLDPQKEIANQQSTQSTAEHDTLTGSRTAPPPVDPSARAAADSALESATAQTALFGAQQQHQASLDQELRQQAWQRMLIESEEREAAAAETAAMEQSLIDQDEAFTQQQAAAAETAAEQQALDAEKIEHTQTWLPFYSDLAGGSQSEGIRVLNQEYGAGVRDPIAHRYDTIAAGLQPQLGVAPSELHRETDRRLRQQIGEKWYNVYRGIDPKPTPQERAHRAAAAADAIVEGETDEQAPPTGTQPTGRGVEQATSEETKPDATGVDTLPTDDATDPRENIPAARIGTENTGYESDGVTGHRVRPVLRELDELVPSHDITGEKRQDYPEDLQPREGRGGAISMEQVRNTARQPNFAFLLEFFKQFRDGAPVTSKKHPRRVVSGNGRTLALQVMRQDYPENWEGYQATLRAELERVGIDPAEADAMQAPVLTYELMDDTDEVALAKDANVQATLDHTAAEQASQDTAYFDDDLMGLWQPGEGSFEEALKSEENQPFRAALFNRIPTHLVSAFMTADNKNFSNDGIQRIQNAMIRYVFGGEIGDQLSSVFIEIGLEGVKNIESMVRNAIASLAYAKANGQDISTALAAAIFRFIEINNTAEREAQQRRLPKETLLAAGIDAVYKSGELIAGPTLLEKQLLYLVYAKRNAPRQLADDFQSWSKTAVSEAPETDIFGNPDETGIASEAIFAGMIRQYIRDTIFETRQTQDGRTVLLPPESMPPELVDLRESMDAMSGAADKERFANDWIDAFLRMMNEGEPQAEIQGDDPDATQTETQTAVGVTPPADPGTPRGTEPETRQGIPDRADTRTPETPERPSAMARTQHVGTQGAESGGAPGDTEGVYPDDPGAAVGIEDTEDVIDTNQVVGVSRQQTQTSTASVSPVVKRALDILNISVADWESKKAAGDAEALLNAQPQETLDQIDAVTDLAGDIAGEMSAEDLGFEDDTDFEDDDFFNDVERGRLRDITDAQRSDFETVRRKLFLAKTIARLAAKGADRTPLETAQLRALEAPQRTDAQQEIYQRLLTGFIDAQVNRLSAKPQRSVTENRILEALRAVQAQGLPEEASDLSLYSDLETPDQEHSRLLAETRTLTGVQAPDTSGTVLNLPESVTAEKTKLSPAQQTSVKAILAAFERKIHVDTDTTVQGGFLLGDKPGVGKTRQALATLWHFLRQGINTHFILAPNEQLLNNYSADMQVMGGPVGDISHYDSSNPQLTTPIGTATYSMLTRKPDLANYATPTGTQNAIADIVEHLTGARPTLQQTHPATYQALREAYARILPNLQGALSVADGVAELRRQAERVNLENPANVEQFRQRVTPLLGDLLLAERIPAGQQELFTQGEAGSELYTRVQQLLTFADNILTTPPDPDFAAKAAAFQGVIVLDEMHKAAGTDSQTGRRIEKLHELLPNAKFLYMSATPFKEIENFRVAERLGLWGANQPFENFGQFRGAFRRAGRGVKEVIPLHLKQIGRYLSRALSAKETRYTPVEVPLTDTEKAQYDTAVDLVRGLRQHFESAIDAARRTPWGSTLDTEGEFHQYRGKYMRMFYGTMQVFYLALLDAMKAQGLQEDIRDKLQSGDKVIVQLENTWEQSIARAEQREKTGTIGPFDLLIDFVENENTFPVHLHHTEVRTRRDGEPYTVVVPQRVYEDGAQVRAVDPYLKRLQTQLLNRLQHEMQRNVFAGGLPFAADILHAIATGAGVASGEISGRSEIHVRDTRDTPQRMPQDPESRIARAKAFSETTDLNLMVLGPAGLTGINLPVSETLKDTVNNLYHYLVQSSWNVNTFEQGLGRGKRSNSAIDPQYQVVYQDLPGGDRVLGATLAKFAEMGALAGQADNALMQNIDKVEGETSLEDDPEADVDVFEETQEGERSHVFGVHGQEALAQLWQDMYEMGEFEIADRLGLTRPEIAGGTGFIDPDTVPSVQQFFQRLLHQSTTEQPRLYEQFESRLKRILAYRRELGQLDVGAKDLNSKDGQISDRVTIYTDPDTGQTAEMVRLSVQRKLPRRSWEFTQKVIRQEPGYEQHGRTFQGIYTDAEGHVWAVFEAPFTQGQETEYIRWGPRGTPVQGLHPGEHRVTAETLENDFTAVSEMRDAQRLWDAEDTAADTYVDSELFLATGLILPKWQDLSTRSREHALMAVIPMLDGRQLHGRVIPSTRVPEVLERIGGVDPNYFSRQLSAVSNQQETPEATDIDIPEIVRDIIGDATDPRVAARLERIVEHIHRKLPLRLRGHRVRDAAEAALLGQLIRDPQVEHTWIVYRKDDRIVKIEPFSLNRKGETEAGDFAHIKREVGNLQADSILRIHNHPSGVAKWSPADKNVAMEWHRQLGTLMAEDIIVDSGTYAYRTFVKGEYTWHEETVLDPSAVEWATGAVTVRDASGERKPTDPLYQNPLIRGAREAATYMLSIKHRTTDIAELIYVDSQTGKIADTFTDTALRHVTDPVQSIQSSLLGPSRKGQHVHIAMWGDDTAVSLASSLQEIEGVDSVWVNSQRVTGIDHITPETLQTPEDVIAETTTDTAILSDYTAAVQRTNPDSVVYRVHAPEDLAMEGRGRAKTAELGEKALNTFVDSNAGILKVLKAWSPTARRWARLTKNEFVSGFGKLTDLEAPEGSDAPAPADVLKEILRERQHISKLNAGRALSTLEPHLLSFNKLAGKRTGLRRTAAAPGTRQATRMAMSHQVWNFIEYNTPLENDPELLSIAADLKQAWRELLIHDTQKIVELMGELEKMNEKLYVTDAAGKREEWYGVPFDGFEWDPERKGYIKDGTFYTIADAHRAANQLYMPHYFRGTSPLQEYSALQKVLDDLNRLLAAETVTTEDLQRFGIEFDERTSLYTHTPTGKTASTPYEMVRIVADYLATEDAALQGIVNYYEDEGRVGYYGHLERTRETDDRFYIRDISLMPENRIRLWDRLAEVAVIGQQHPLLGDSPRMKTLIEQVMTFDKTPREAALRKVVEALNAGQEGMFQRMPQFATGVDTALDIMQHWLERDADGEKTGRYQEIDIGRMNLDDATLAELERIGLIEQDGDGWKVVGSDLAQRHATMARHIHEFYNTLAQRKNAVHSIVLGLGNWHTRDPLEMESSEFWKKINDSITVLTLNHGVAIQNLLEIPMISMITGANPLFKGMRHMTTNPDYRNAMQQLARGLSHARKFMADTSLADKYLGSPLTFFSKSDEFSRAAGLGIGLENAKEKIQQFAEATDPKKKAALAREMDAVRLNTEIVGGIPESRLQSVLAAAEALILNTEVETVFSSEKGSELSPAERLAGTMLRSMFYISDETFKQYDATSLPKFMVSRNPLIRVFMKYKSWMLQQNRLVYNQLKRAGREAKKGNLKPLSDFVAATAMMGLGTGGLLWLYSALQGNDDDKTVRDRLFKGLAAAQTFGIASVMFELAMYAEGNWYQMQNLLAKQAAGPAFSVAAQMVAPVFTGDFGQAGEEALRRLPIVSFSRRVGGWRLLEEATGNTEEE